MRTSPKANLGQDSPGPGFIFIKLVTGYIWYLVQPVDCIQWTNSSSGEKDGHILDAESRKRSAHAPVY